MSRPALLTRALAFVMLACVGCVRPIPNAPIVDHVPAQAQPSAPVHSLPISGGTLRVAADLELAALSDPEHDRVWLVELASMRVRAEVALSPGDEPGRITEDRGRRFHVALRGGGAVATIDDRGELVMRRRVCPSPRGIELDPSADVLHVACAGGELVTLGIFDPSPRRTLFLPPDLRDLVVEHDRIHVSRFRSAEVLTVSSNGRVASTRRPDEWDLDRFLDLEPRDRPRRTYEPTVAWRMVKDPRTGELLVLHQRAAKFPIDLVVADERRSSGPYGGMLPPRMRECPPGIAHGAFTTLDPRAPDREDPARLDLSRSVLDRFRLSGSARAGTTILGEAVLAVDAAFSPDGRELALAIPGARHRQLAVGTMEELAGRTCAPLFGHPLREPGGSMTLLFRDPVSVAWIDASHLAVQYRRPHSLVVYDVTSHRDGRFVELGERTPLDRGQELFHEGTSSNLACATCHPEGGDDGHVWHLGALGGRRRTQALHGDVTSSAPFHWSGDLASLSALMDEVFSARMGGRRPSSVEVDALGAFLASFPAAPRASVRNAESVERGHALFDEVGCARCHSGPRMSDGRAHDVGTGEALQTPTLLGLAPRAPYLHDGRAHTLRDRFTEAGHTRGHGELAHLEARSIDDLVAYLASL